MNWKRDLKIRTHNILFYLSGFWSLTFVFTNVPLAVSSLSLNGEAYSQLVWSIFFGAFPWILRFLTPLDGEIEISDKYLIYRTKKNGSKKVALQDVKVKRKILATGKGFLVGHEWAPFTFSEVIIQNMKGRRLLSIGDSQINDLELIREFRSRKVEIEELKEFSLGYWFVTTAVIFITVILAVKLFLLIAASNYGDYIKY